jgi:hypothetical protein
MRRPWGRARVYALVSVLALVALTSIAVIDHRSKEDRLQRAREAEFLCTRDGMRCNEEKPASIQQGWHERERFYRGAFAIFVLVGAGSLIIPNVHLRRRPQ